VDNPISPGSIPNKNEIAPWAISISLLISHTGTGHSDQLLKEINVSEQIFTGPK
jgi:hypothetical protein